MRLRKTTYAVLAIPPHLLAYVGTPTALSRFGRHHGWRNGRPGRANILGVLLLAGGGAMLAWAIASHYRTAPEEADVSLVPTYLVQGGAYAHTRNPMYLAATAMLIGWAAFFGSVPLAAVVVGYIVGIDRVAIPFEERMLHNKFGDSFDEYRQQVPRWL